MPHHVETEFKLLGRWVKAEMDQSGNSLTYDIWWGDHQVEMSSCTTDCWDWKRNRAHGAAALACDQKQLREYAEESCARYIDYLHEQIADLKKEKEVA